MFIYHLKKRGGWNVLGSGAYSTVLEHPKNPNKVLKVIRQEDGWINYICWGASKGFSGTFTPKVYSYKRVKGKEKDFYLASMERLEYTAHGAGRGGFDHTYNDEVEAKGFFYKHLFRPNANRYIGDMMEKLEPGFSGFAQDLAKTFTDGLDIHGGNVMFRKDGGLCVTDPVACSSTVPIQVNRLRGEEFSRVTIH